MNAFSFELSLLAASLLLLASVLASRASGRLGVPALLVFLAVGMLAGSEGPGGIPFDDPLLTQWVGIIALAYILFAGGLDTHWQLVKPVLAQSLVLATVGVLVTAVLVGWFAWLTLGFSPLEGFLLGAIVSSTDAAAVFAVLRARGVRISPRLRGILELESGSNDPMAVFLTGAAIVLLQRPDAGAGFLLFDFFRQMALGCVFGFALGWLAARLINWIELEYDGLYAVLTLAWVPLTYALTTVVGGNGFLAVYVAALVMANSRFLHKRKLTRFHDGLAWLMQIAMFLTLGLLVFPSRLLPIAGASIMVAIFVMVVARPIAVLLSLLPFRMPAAEKGFLGWVGLRGAVPIVLATFPISAGVDRAGVIFNIVFFIVLTSVLLQGTSIPLAARLLRLDRHSEDADPALPLRRESELLTVEVQPGSPASGSRVVNLRLHADTLILLIYRGGGFFVPDGRALVEAGDKLMIFTSKASVEGVRAMTSGEQPRTG